MRLRGLIAASFLIVVAFAGPAQAQDVDGCTSDLVDAIAGGLFEPSEDPPYPIVERDPQTGSITIHPQNVVPATQYAIDGTLAYVGEVAGHVVTWVDCID